ncbi:hypothetical protein RIF29_17363 [Crotalaria pallida]|uniref:Uncharacterized protein n=1 Tax=Crotalaria pallida TaxID=3830 RepID=A0AAN9FKD2_CROPI
MTPTSCWCSGARGCTCERERERERERVCYCNNTHSLTSYVTPTTLFTPLSFFLFSAFSLRFLSNQTTLTFTMLILP